MNSKLEIKDKTKPVDNIKISPFRKNIRKTSPHKHNNYFEIIYLTSGKGNHTIDTQEFTITPPIIFIVRKEQVHFWNIESEPSGFVIIIKKEFIDNSLDKEIKQLISKISAYTCLYPNEKKTIEQLFELLCREYQESKNDAIIEGLTKALLAKLLQSEKPENLIVPHKDNLFEQFRELLGLQKKLVNKVAYYANLLNTTPQNLNAVCRRENNQSASEVISEFIISEAKRLLLYTDLTITEISYSLDFKDNSHFTKYFKRYASKPPSVFRSTIQ
ncbi:helix-turn-helix domain-containing protein [Flavobacterium weaverense]|uniref:AraC family transcriptional regulator n=1 Tax=Flavobacterium weaverense TaxID=271156 RepID=A0A3L9ZLG9_9FLAO|nr:helix-turn-helix domain-containing protein [Flavobacterium weaverense]RMA73134.1 AraC family transcriptional regulator [Flavobacterium weaverense]